MTFPSQLYLRWGNQFGLKTRLEEITYAISCGAREIDNVTNRQSLTVAGSFRGMQRLLEYKNTSSNSSYSRYTSMGKESVNATLQVTLVTIWGTIQTGWGVRTVRVAILRRILVNATLRVEWFQPSLFLFGTSGPLDDIDKIVRIL
uniref:Uncharacterized protein n=1 Tax=Glossina palpalis gambiensis TaxID=67801 RepID=A0A1B0C1V1_9MUSC